MNKIKISLFAMIILATTFFSIGCTGQNTKSRSFEKPKNIAPPVVMRNINGPRYYLCDVTKIVDGDTIDVSFSIWNDITLQKRIRFERIDTWEVRGEEKEKGLIAKNFLISLLKKGSVYLKTQGKTGKYGRTIGSIIVITKNKIIDIEKELESNGHTK